ncbi:MAG: 7-cyano-7-deazaguanine synthase QueC [Candidatus Heimdallarchaeota archaeon]|nr:7-cyano-7-deazaguanine synthase QueC [Candidatus Heimdallarchaeota archaeon]
MYRLIAEKKEVYALSYNYGQKHTKELDAAKISSTKLNIPHKIVSLKGLMEANIFGNNAITSNIPIPEGHYAEDSMKATVVPNRNMIMISIAISYAISLGASDVYYGAHAGDHAIYPDCRPEFVDAMDHVSNLCDYQKISLKSPYLHYSKAEIVAEGLKFGVDYASTWTCYKGEEKACGKCGSCVERLEAFQKNKIKDPLDYVGESA